MRLRNKNRQGYIKTKVGWIPEDWTAGVFQDLVTLQRGFDLPAKNRKPGNYPVVSSAGIIESHDEWQASPPGIVTGRYGTVGEVFYLDCHYWPLNTTLFSKELHGNCGKFIYHFLQNFDFRSFSAKTGVPGINRNDLHREPAAIPPLPEQEAIAGVLECWDKAIRKYEEKIDKKRNIKKGLMQRLLSGEQRLPGFEGEWKTIQLEEIAQFIKDGTHGTHTDVESGIPLLSAKDLQDGKVRVPRDSRKISDAEFSKIHRKYSLQNGDVLLSVVGTLGKVAAVENYDRSYTFQRSVAIIRPNRLTEYSFLVQKFHCLSFQKELRRREKRGAQGGVYLGELAKIRLSLPEIQEQRAIASVLSTADAEIAALENKRDLLKNQKKYLLNNLVTGTIRLPQFITKKDQN